MKKFIGIKNADGKFYKDKKCDFIL